MKCTTSGSDVSCVNGTRSSLCTLFLHRFRLFITLSLSLERSANQLSSAHRTKGLSLIGGEQDLVDDLDYAVARPHVALDDGGVATAAQHGLGIGPVLDLGGAHPKILSLKS